MHALACLQETAEQLWSKLIELLVRLGTHQVEHLFNFLNENDFFGWACDGPEFQQALDQWHIQGCRFLQVVLDTELQLRIVSR